MRFRLRTLLILLAAAPPLLPLSADARDGKPRNDNGACAAVLRAEGRMIAFSAAPLMLRSMTTSELDRALKKRGWHYDVENEVFRNRGRRLNYQQVGALMPGMTLDELASYQDDQYD